MVQWMKYQITEKFLPYAGQKPTWAPWESTSSLFCIALLSYLMSSDMDRYKRCGNGLRPTKTVDGVIQNARITL